jgi:ubiquinone biosynthesis protein
VSSSNVANFLIGAVIDIPVLAYAARRLLGVRRFSLTRTVIAGVAGILGGSAIMNALANGLTHPSKHVGPVLGIIGLGVASALLLSMAILVIWQAIIPAGTVPSPSSWPRRLRARGRRTRRYWQIVRIFTAAGVGPLFRSGPVLSASLAHSLSAALDRSGVVFVKFGQALSTRRDLLPAEFTAELARLQDRVSPLPWPEIERILNSEQLDGAFAEIDHEPLASASIAQVHVARLRTGEEVVVKVRRPDVPALAERDLDIIARLAHRLELRTAWARTLGVVKLAEGFAAALREELDFRVELRNLESVSATDGVVIPRAYPDLSSGRVLVMQRLDGVAISKASLAGLDRDRLASDLLGTVLHQIVVDGIFHADPHPGNILLLADGRLGLIDFGSVGRLDSELRSALQRLLLALDRRDPVALTDALLEVTARPDELDQQALERALGSLLMRLSGATALSGTDGAMFADLFRIVARYRLEVPPEFAAVFRALSTLEGGLTALAPGFDIVAQAERFGRAELGSPDSLQAALSDEAMALLPMLRRLPRRLDRITAAVEGGRLNVNVRLLADERDRNTVTGWLHQLTITVLAATAGLMAVVLLAIKGGPVMTPTVSLYQFLGYCLLVICSLLALRVLARVFRAELVNAELANDARGCRG